MLDRELEIAIEAAQRAGRAICDVYERDDFEVRQKADDKGPLTEADLAANRVILETLRAAFPDDGILSEEATDDASRLDKDRVWIVDPLDGTREFTLRIPEFAVSIGLVIGGEARVGVLLNPATRELFTGVVGQGATYNGQPCRVSDHGTVKGARLLVSRSEHKKGWFEAWERDADLQPMGSVAYKFARVAAGLAEATFTPRPRSEWDLCGGVACLVAAGGRATDARGEPYRFNQADPLVDGVCGSNGGLHAAVLEMMKGR